MRFLHLSCTDEICSHGVLIPLCEVQYIRQAYLDDTATSLIVDRAGNKFYVQETFEEIMQSVVRIGEK